MQIRHAGILISVLLVPGAASAAPGPAQTRDVVALGSVAFDGTLTGAGAGSRVAGLGDVNGDGIGDLAVTTRDPAEVHVVFGTRTPVGGNLGLFSAATARGFRISGPPGFGAAVTGVADVDGDGRRDIAVGHPSGSPSGRAAAGLVYVVFTPDVARDIDVASLGAGGYVLAGAAAGDRAGTSLADPGDIDGDGSGDLLTGAPGVSAGGAGRGAAFLVPGMATSGSFDLVATPGGTSRFLGEGAGQRAGLGVAAGDLTGDGVTDLVVAGAAGTPGGGMVHVVSGAVRTSLTLTTLETASRGYSVRSTAGPLAAAVVPDQNGDRRADLLLGAGDADAGAGRAALVFGSAASAEYVLGGPAPGGFEIGPPPGATRFGAVVASAGDQDGDGVGDLLVAGTGPSATLVFGGPRTAAVSAEALGGDGVRLTTPDLAPAETIAVAGAGDVTGDGRPDLLLGIPEAPTGGVVRAGRAWLVTRIAPSVPAAPAPPAGPPSSGPVPVAALTLGRLRVTCAFAGRGARVCRGRITVTAAPGGRVLVVLRRGTRAIRLVVPVRDGANTIVLPGAVRGRVLAPGRWSVRVTPVGASGPVRTAGLVIRRR